MDPFPRLSVTPVLRQAAELKTDELNSAKEAFKHRYRLDARRSAEPNTLTRVKSLIEDVKKLNPDIAGSDGDLDNLDLYLDEAEDGWCFSESKMLRCEEKIYSKLRKYLNRLEVSTLHVELMRDAMAVENTPVPTPNMDSNIDLVDFEVVDDFDEARAEYERVAFTAREVDITSIEAFLAGLVKDDNEVDFETVGFETVQSRLRSFCEDLESDGVEVDLEFLMFCIVNLLQNSLIGEGKKKTLQDYLHSPIAMRELESTINVKSIRNWEYKNADKGLPVSVRQSLDGQCCVVLEEDIVDMLFLHCVGLKWAFQLRECLMDYGYTSFEAERLTPEQSLKRQYYLDRASKPAASPTPPGMCSTCHPLSAHASQPPPPPFSTVGAFVPPPPPPEIIVVEDPRRKEKKYTGRSSWGESPLFLSRGNIARIRDSNYKKDFFMSRLPFEDGCTPRFTPFEDTQAALSKTLAVELKLRDGLDGLVSSGSARFKPLASTLPPQTALAVLKFLGVTEAALDFVERFLAAKVNLGPKDPSASDQIVQRACGLSEGNALEIIVTEATMYFLELAVRRATGSYLYRLKNDCYFVGTYDQHERYETQVSRFADVMGLEVSFEQKLSIGFMQLSPGSISIDEAKVAKYAQRIEKRLDACSAVLDWVRVWNSTVGTYAAHLFGPPANIFGKSHVDMVRKAYKTMFHTVLEGKSLTDYIKHLLVKHIGQALPESSFSLEAFIYLPQQYGGLGVKNPFVTLNLSHDFPDQPDELLAQYPAVEEAYYKRAAEIYTQLPPDARARKLEALFDNKDDRIAAVLGPDRDLTAFMSMEECTERREIAAYPHISIAKFSPPLQHPSLLKVYKELLIEPEHDIPNGERVRQDVRRLQGTGDMQAWHKLSAEEKWVLQLYGDECFEKYDGLEQWVGQLVPQEVLKAIRGAKWGDDDDDDSTTNSGYASP